MTGDQLKKLLNDEGVPLAELIERSVKSMKTLLSTNEINKFRDTLFKVNEKPHMGKTRNYQIYGSELEALAHDVQDWYYESFTMDDIREGELEDLLEIAENRGGENFILVQGLFYERTLYRKDDKSLPDYIQWIKDAVFHDFSSYNLVEVEESD